MPTTVTSTIGTAGTYTSLQAWEDACPANLVTDDKIWRGEVKNQELSGAAALCTISGQTTDSTRYIELTAEAGASFIDHANVRTNGLRYNASNGAAINGGLNYGQSIVVANTAYTRISRLQMKNVGNGPAITIKNNCLLKDSIALSSSNSSTVILDGGGTLINVLAISDTNANVAGIVSWNSFANVAYNCLSVRPSNRTVNGAAYNYNYSYKPKLVNCAGFGFSSFIVDLASGSSHNASDQAISAGSNNQASLTYADQFENPSSASSVADFRTKTGAALIDNGTDTSANGVTTDISGLSRSGAYDIGVWETLPPPITAEGAITFADMTIAGEATYTAPSAGGVHGVVRRRVRRQLWNDVPVELKPVVALAEEWADETPVQRAVDEALARYARLTARASVARRDRLIDEMKRAIVHAVERAAEADDEEALIALL